MCPRNIPCGDLLALRRSIRSTFPPFEPAPKVRHNSIPSAVLRLPRSLAPIADLWLTLGRSRSWEAGHRQEDYC